MICVISAHHLNREGNTQRLSSVSGKGLFKNMQHEKPLWVPTCGCHSLGPTHLSEELSNILAKLAFPNNQINDDAKKGTWLTDVSRVGG